MHHLRRGVKLDGRLRRDCVTWIWFATLKGPLSLVAFFMVDWFLMHKSRQLKEAMTRSIAFKTLWIQLEK